MNVATQWQGGVRALDDDALIRAMIEAGRDEPVSAVDMGWTLLACALWGLVLWVLFFKALLSLL